MTTSSDVYLCYVVFVASCLLFLQTKRKIKGSVASSNKEPKTTIAESQPFPWEPSFAASLAEEVSCKKEKKTSDKDDSRQKQLEFLASMTFAGGGLRAPSCPCCQ